MADIEVDLTKDGTAQLLEFAKRIAVEGGRIIKDAFDKPPTQTYGRKSATDPVTETDNAVEQYILGEIRARYPDHTFIGEESASAVEWTDAPTWITDPLDGTANFVHRIPLCCVSIGFTYQRRLIIGVVYNPMLGELYEATHLTTSKCNDIPIRVSAVDNLNSACVATEAGSDRSDHKVDWIITNLKAILRNEAQCIRMMGSCALNMCNVARGRVDILYERGPFPWDMAAGALIIRQAGGIVCGGGEFDPNKEFDLTARSLLAFTPTLKNELDVLARNS